MADKYDTLQEGCDSLLTAIVPSLTKDDVGTVIKDVNTLVRHQKPPSQAFTEQPRVILGITSDQELVVYGKAGKLGSYHAKPYVEVYAIVSRMCKRAHEEARYPRVHPKWMVGMQHADDVGRALKVQHAEGLVERLGKLRSARVE